MDSTNRQAFYSAMRALVDRANAIREHQPNFAVEDLVKVGHMLHYLDPNGEIPLFDGIRDGLA